MTNKKTAISKPVVKTAVEQKVLYDLNAPKIKKLTVEVKRIYRDVQAFTSQKAVEMGGKLKQIKEGLGRGNWLKWIDMNYEFSDRNAERFIKVSEFAKLNPAEYRMARLLGFTKLSMLAYIPQNLAKAIIRKRVHRIPGYKVPINLITASVNQMIDIIKYYTKKPAITPGSARRRFRDKVETIRTDFKEMIKDKEKLDQKEVTEWVSELRNLANDLEGLI